MKFLVTNDDGWDAPGLAALKSLAAELGEVYVLAPRDPHSYAGHRVTTDVPMILSQTGILSETSPREFHLSGTPADCVRVALTSVFPDVDWVLAGINKGGNLGADLFTSGTIAAAREAALLGKPAIAISQYMRKNLALDWNNSSKLARPVIEQLLLGIPEPCGVKGYWNVNLPHLENGVETHVVRCDPDNERMDVRFHREGDQFRFAGTYSSRPFTPGYDIDHCFQGAITISHLRL